ncbi:hypothetical protein C4588_08055 [Candidatus Parcubacteria bacterium]|nr:MAG: hypothetical protein C4588_08055 [Candidatus Parcubacteria bacterium]
MTNLHHFCEGSLYQTAKNEYQCNLCNMRIQTITSIHMTEGIRPLIPPIKLDGDTIFGPLSKKENLKYFPYVSDGLQMLIIETNEIFKYSASRKMWIKTNWLPL